MPDRELKTLINEAYHACRSAQSYGESYHVRRAETVLKKVLDLIESRTIPSDESKVLNIQVKTEGVGSFQFIKPVDEPNLPTYVPGEGFGITIGSDGSSGKQPSSTTNEVEELAKCSFSVHHFPGQYKTNLSWDTCSKDVRDWHLKTAIGLISKGYTKSKSMRLDEKAVSKCITRYVDSNHYLTLSPNEIADLICDKFSAPIDEVSEDEIIFLIRRLATSIIHYHDKEGTYTNEQVIHEVRFRELAKALKAELENGLIGKEKA